MPHYFIGIDGPAGAGKTSTARELARRLSFLYIDTGAFYRTFAIYVRCMQMVMKWLDPVSNEPDVDAIAKFMTEQAPHLLRISAMPRLDGQVMYLNGDPVAEENLRSDETSQLASRLSAIPAVRDFLRDKQLELSRQYNTVMEGRDVCTCLKPDADLKIFLTADLDIRAKRRAAQLKQQGESCDLQELTASMALRDDRDQNRGIAPLQPAEDSHEIDNGDMTLDETVETILTLVRQDEVMRFIQDFHQRLGSEHASHAFRAGMCYHFASMLQAVFQRGQIAWAAPFGHIVWEDVDRTAYDSEGIYRGEAEAIIPVSYIKDHLEDFTGRPIQYHDGASSDYIRDAMERYYRHHPEERPVVNPEKSDI